MFHRARRGIGRGDPFTTTTGCGHLDLSAGDEVKDTGHTSLHVVHGSTVRVHVARFGRFAVLCVRSPSVVVTGVGIAVPVAKIVRAFVRVTWMGMCTQRGVGVVRVRIAVFRVLITAYTATSSRRSAGFLMMRWFRDWGGVGWRRLSNHWRQRGFAVLRWCVVG